MDTWVRLASGDTWHLLANTTGNGLRLAYCAKTFAPGEALARRALADTPASANTCPTCEAAAYQRQGVSGATLSR